MKFDCSDFKKNSFFNSLFTLGQHWANICSLLILFAVCSYQEMAEVLNDPRVYSFLHVPIQSASDSVLMDMKREYCQDDFKHIADFLKDRYVSRIKS